MKNLLYSLPEDLQQKIIKMNKAHPLAEIMKPSINKFNDIENERSKITYEVISNFASDFFCLRDISRLQPLVDENEYMLLCRQLIYNYSYYFYYWLYNNRYKNWYYKREGNKIYF